MFIDQPRHFPNTPPRLSASWQLIWYWCLSLRYIGIERSGVLMCRWQVMLSRWLRNEIQLFSICNVTGGFPEVLLNSSVGTACPLHPLYGWGWPSYMLVALSLIVLFPARSPPVSILITELQNLVLSAVRMQRFREETDWWVASKEFTTQWGRPKRYEDASFRIFRIHKIWIVLFCYHKQAGGLLKP